MITTTLCGLFLRKWLLGLDNECTAVHRVDQDESTGEATVVAPRAAEFQRTSILKVIILRVGVEPGNLSYTATGRIIRNRRDVQDAETGRVHTLVRVFAKDVLVVIDGLARSLVVACLLGMFKVANVPDESHRATVGSGTAGFNLIILVIRNEPLLVFCVKDPALVSVRGPLIRSDGHSLRELLIRDIVCAVLAGADTMQRNFDLQMVMESSLKA